MRRQIKFKIRFAHSMPLFRPYELSSNPFFFSVSFSFSFVDGVVGEWSCKGQGQSSSTLVSFYSSTSPLSLLSLLSTSLTPLLSSLSSSLANVFCQDYCLRASPNVRWRLQCFSLGDDEIRYLKKYNKQNQNKKTNKNQNNQNNQNKKTNKYKKTKI